MHYVFESPCSHTETIVCNVLCVFVWLCSLPRDLIPEHNSMWMAAESGRVFTEEQEELPACGPVTHTPHTHTRSQSHIQFQPLSYTSQWQPVAHTRSHSHTHFNAVSHTQPQKYGCRLTHSLSAMTKGERGVQVSVGKSNKPTDPLFSKPPQQVSSPGEAPAFVPYRGSLSFVRCVIALSSHVAVRQSDVLCFQPVAVSDWIEKGEKDRKFDGFSSLSEFDSSDELFCGER